MVLVSDFSSNVSESGWPSLNHVSFSMAAFSAMLGFE